jgi:thioredoxin 1
MKRILCAMALALIPAAGAAFGLTALGASPAMAEPMMQDAMPKDAMAKDSMMMTAPARGLFVFDAYDSAAFQARLAARAPTILVFTKQGCPVCTRQVRALQDVLKESAFVGVTVQQVDFIGQSAIARQFGVTGQSTILAYRNGAEVSRRTGDATPEAIRAQLAALIG